MTITTLAQIMDALATQLRTQLDTGLAGIQVEPRLVFNPTPPCIDMYPADPFLEQQAYGEENRDMFLTIRARVTTADNEGGQDLLLDLMDPRGSTSLVQAIAYDDTLSGTVSQVQVTEGPTGFQVYPDSGNAGALLGCQWTARVIL